MFGLIAAVIGYVALVALGLSLILQQEFVRCLTGLFVGLEIAVIVAQLLSLLHWLFIARHRGNVLVDFDPGPQRASSF